jgi:hypothetical protein
VIATGVAGRGRTGAQPACGRHAEGAQPSRGLLIVDKAMCRRLWRALRAMRRNPCPAAPLPSSNPCPAAPLPSSNPCPATPHVQQQPMSSSNPAQQHPCPAATLVQQHPCPAATWHRAQVLCAAFSPTQCQAHALCAGHCSVHQQARPKSAVTARSEQRTTVQHAQVHELGHIQQPAVVQQIRLLRCIGHKAQPSAGHILMPGLWRADPAAAAAYGGHQAQGV